MTPFFANARWSLTLASFYATLLAVPDRILDYCSIAVQ
jgi:hypothetical protein